jgi:hypothetical protein
VVLFIVVSEDGLVIVGGWVVVFEDVEVYEIWIELM